MPPGPTVFRWPLDDKHKQFWDQHEKARNVQAEMMFEELLEIADDGTNDYMTRHRGDDDEDGYEVPDHEHTARSRLRVVRASGFPIESAPQEVRGQDGPDHRQQAHDY